MAPLPHLPRSEVSECFCALAKGWLSSQMPLGEDEGTVAALDLSAHPLCSQRWWSEEFEELLSFCK